MPPHPPSASTIRAGSPCALTGTELSRKSDKPFSGRSGPFPYAEHGRLLETSIKSAKVALALPRTHCGSASAKKLVPQPHPIRVDNVRLAIVSNLLDLTVEKIWLD